MSFVRSGTFVALIGCFFLESSAIIIGSLSTPSVQAYQVFPATDTNNTLLGFASFDNGFSLFDNTTTATFNTYMPVSGPVSLNNGQLVLAQDFILANNALFVSGGTILGNNNSIILPTYNGSYVLPLGLQYNFSTRAALNLENEGSPADARTLDWAFDNNYLACGQRTIVTGAELKILYFSGTTLTTTLSVEFNNEVSSVRWHPSQRYVAVGLTAGAGDELKIYAHRVYNGTLIQTTGISVPNSLLAVSWHPSGNYLVCGGDTTTNQLRIYPVTSGVAGAATTLTIASGQTVNRDALSFSPGGDKIAVGLSNNATVNTSELMIYNFAATSLTLTTSIDTRANLQSVDWSPTGSFIAAGLTGSSRNIRVYEISSGKVRELINNQQVENRDVYSVHWHPSGNYLLTGIDMIGDARKQKNLYFFDKINKQLIFLSAINSLDEVWTNRWSPNGLYHTYGYQTPGGQLQVVVDAFDTNKARIILDNTTLVCQSDLILSGDIHFKGTCRLETNGHMITIDSGCEIVVRTNSAVIIDNALIAGVRGSNIRCMNNTGKIIFQASSLFFDRAFTFSQGSFSIEQDVIFSGTQQFNYTTPLTSTIANQAMLMLDNRFIFNYSPARAKKDLIFLPSAAAELYLNGCTLQSTRTGLQITSGKMIIDNNVTLSSGALYRAEGILLGQLLDIQIQGGATLDVYGQVLYG